MRIALIGAGLGQLLLALASLVLPRVLGWREQASRLGPLTRSVFWTYAGYILGTNVAFGLVSTLAPHWLTDGTPLARAVCGFIACYWGARLAIQGLVFRPHVPPGRPYRLADAAVAVLFLYLTVVYGVAAAASGRAV